MELTDTQHNVSMSQNIAIFTNEKNPVLAHQVFSKNGADKLKKIRLFDFPINNVSALLISQKIKPAILKVQGFCVHLMIFNCADAHKIR